VFFYLHKHCNLDKKTIMTYTYAQVQELMAQCHKYIQFEVEIQTAPIKSILGMFGGGGGGSIPDSSSHDDTDYIVASEEDINLFAAALGG
jgi:hypothetical protein